MDIVKIGNFNDTFVIEKFPKEPIIFEYLSIMFKNYFSGFDIWENVGINRHSESGDYLQNKFEYYKNIYDLIQKYWKELKGVFECIAISQPVTDPGDLFILILKNDSLLWQQNKKVDKSKARNLFEAWYEYQSCKISGKYSKKLDTLRKRIEKKAGKTDYENTLILELIANVLSGEDKTKFENREDSHALETTRHLRNVRDIL